jgi:hypothetical protein
VALAAAAIALLVLATPAGRHAVAGLLEVAGIKVTWGVESARPGALLDLGEVVTLDQAADRVSFELLVPVGAVVGESDVVYFSQVPSGGAVHLVWEAGRSLPAAGETGVGLLYSQFMLGEPEVFIKSLSPDVEALRITVRGREGLWIEGAPHIIVYDNGSVTREEPARLAANVLAWEEDGVTHRIETTLGLEDALDLAESLQPLP